MAARIVILASGSGTTAQAILDDAELGGSVVALGSDVAGCGALQRAEAVGLPTFTVALRDFAERTAWNEALAAALTQHAPDLVVLAGFMRLLGPPVLDRFPVVNTHPALLPGFPGAHAVRDALAAGVRTTGASVHWVDEGIDTGQVIAQVEVAVQPGDDEQRLRERIQAAEKPLYVSTLRQLCREIAS